jgi:hypothetical protein
MNTNYIYKNIEKVVETYTYVCIYHTSSAIIFATVSLLIKIASPPLLIYIFYDKKEVPFLYSPNLQNYIISLK